MHQLYTRWGKELQASDLKEVLTSYPRPSLQRASYINLNGLWDYAFCKKLEPVNTFDGQILVPFSPEAVLSGVNRQLQPEEFLCYHKSIAFDPQAILQGQRLLLHFGAVDHYCKLYVNGHFVGEHEGGYTPFTFELTHALHTLLQESPSADSFELWLCVQDVSDSSYHAKGKQALNRGGMFYTAQSGIWQTVWMEYVPKSYISGIEIDSDANTGRLHFSVDLKGEGSIPLTVRIAKPSLYIEEELPALEHKDLEWIKEVHFENCEEAEITLDSVCLWTPDTPYLYVVRIWAGEDYIQSYFGLRSFTVEKDTSKLPRICLNHEPFFQLGVLDQGYWPDGLYTAPSDKALLYDIQTMKSMGFNMLRKHCKLEPERWYYHCDRLGMTVWQDMVNGGSAYKFWYVTYLATGLNFLRIRPSDRHSKLLSRVHADGRDEFVSNMKHIVKSLKFHPCISTWVVFNEGWGQFETIAMTKLLRQLDPSRLIDSASGWFDQGCGDLNSIHNYFFPLEVRRDSKRAFVLSEYGGYSMALKDHIYGDKIYGYGTYKDLNSLQAAFDKREKQVLALQKKGLCASVYTQLSDIEDEVNGILTYDREIQKIKRP